MGTNILHMHTCIGTDAYVIPTQGRFHPKESLSSLFAFIKRHTLPTLPAFTLLTPPPLRKITEAESKEKGVSLYSVGLADLRLVTVKWDDGISRGACEAVLPSLLS